MITANSVIYNIITFHIKQMVHDVMTNVVYGEIVIIISEEYFAKTN